MLCIRRWRSSLTFKVIKDTKEKHNKLLLQLDESQNHIQILDIKLNILPKTIIDFELSIYKK